MTDEEQTLMMIRGAIAGLPEDDQIQVIATTLRNILKQDARAPVAFALVAEQMLNAAFPSMCVRISNPHSAPTYQLVRGNHTAERPCPRMDWTTPSGKKVFAFVAPKTRWRERGNWLTGFKRVQEEIPESYVDEALRLLSEAT